MIGNATEPYLGTVPTFEQNGLEVRRLEREGRFFMRPEEKPLDGREEVLGRIVEERAGERRTVWASFNRVKQVDLDTVLEQQEGLTKIVDARQMVVKTAALEEVIDGWSSVEFRWAQSSHSATILASGSGRSLSRATPMPLS